MPSRRKSSCNYLSNALLEITALSLEFRERVCEAFQLSEPCFYYKARGAKSFSVEEKETINSIQFEVLTKLLSKKNYNLNLFSDEPSE